MSKALTGTQQGHCEIGREENRYSRRKLLLSGTSLAATAAILGPPASAQVQAPQTGKAPASGTAGRKPNILMIMADDIGWFNVSAYNHGMMGYRTPNIDRIAKEGAMFTD
jgi:Sulfatase